MVQISICANLPVPVGNIQKSVLIITWKSLDHPQCCSEYYAVFQCLGAAINVWVLEESMQEYFYLKGGRTFFGDQVLCTSTLIGLGMWFFCVISDFQFFGYTSPCLTVGRAFLESFCCLGEKNCMLCKIKCYMLFQ